MNSSRGPPIKASNFAALRASTTRGLGVHLRERLGPDKVVIVYVDMDENIRLQRQMIRQNLTSLDEARKLMLPRDQIKREWGFPQSQMLLTSSSTTPVQWKT